MASCAHKQANSPLRPRNVVLVHGFLDIGEPFDMMQRKLEEQGHRCIAPWLTPSDGRGGLANLAKGLEDDINSEFGTDQPISIVAFSMGGIVSRHYLQQLGGAERCQQFFTISSPHNGTKAAWLYPSQGAEEMRPNSPFLQALESTESRLGEMPVTSYWTPMDLIILPPNSSEWERANNIKVHSPLHPMMLTSPKVINDIIRRMGRESESI